MVDIVHRIGIKASASQVYQALSSLNGLAGWWTDEVSGEGQLNGRIEFVFRSATAEVIGKMVMQVTELVPDKQIRWLCVDGPAEWIKTSITFDLSEQDGQIIVLFGHRGWRETVEFTHHCSTKWAIFLLSLRQYVETGKGQPSPNDLKIDNWN